VCGLPKRRNKKWKRWGTERFWEDENEIMINYINNEKECNAKQCIYCKLWKKEVKENEVEIKWNENGYDAKVFKANLSCLNQCCE
jgi:hypothetical protein